jgi:hypothetical protein
MVMNHEFLSHFFYISPGTYRENSKRRVGRGTSIAGVKEYVNGRDSLERCLCPGRLTAFRSRTIPVGIVFMMLYVLAQAHARGLYTRSRARRLFLVFPCPWSCPRPETHPEMQKSDPNRYACMLLSHECHHAAFAALLRLADWSSETVVLHFRSQPCSFFRFPACLPYRKAYRSSAQPSGRLTAHVAG